ncbi:MAG: hypothetical protein J0H68_02895 [Sphingobacteriia bacterium]|nr:hypothetical protein [Sphingobacteriia bacterium]
MTEYTQATLVGDKYKISVPQEDVNIKESTVKALKCFALEADNIIIRNTLVQSDDILAFNSKSLSIFSSTLESGKHIYVNEGCALNIYNSEIKFDVEYVTQDVLQEIMNGYFS